MAEQVKSFEFSADDLMIDLIEISKQLPPMLRSTSSSGEPMDMKATINRRRSSEHRQILSEILEDKISLSPHVTPSFVNYVVRLFNVDYIQGINEGGVSRFAYFLDLHDSESKGIYDATRAFELERKAFKSFKSSRNSASRANELFANKWSDEFFNKFRLRPGLPNLS